MRRGRPSSSPARTSSAICRSRPIAEPCRACRATPGKSEPESSGLWPHPVAGRTAATHGGGELDELAQDAAGVARVDDLLDPEALGAAEGRAQLVQAILDLAELGLRIGRALDLGTVGRLDAALQRQRAPAPRRPGVAPVEPRAVLVRRPGDAEGVADDEAAPRHGGLEHGRHGAHALADDAALLRLQPD